MTGIIKPSWSFADVFGLKALQKSMIFTPCCPSAGPTGGAGVAFPAGICNFTWPITFFAMLSLLYLKKIQFDRCRAAENGDHHLQRVSVGVHFIDDARKTRKRPIDNLHRFALFECKFGLGFIRRG